MTYPGKLITVEGIDGSGKTTQVKRLIDYLNLKGFQTILVREPGGTEVGEAIRNILLNVEMNSVTELLLFMASRVENIKLNVLPALKEGKVVVCDRFIDSTMAYQGYGREVLSEVLYLQPLIDKLIRPDHTLFLDLRLEDSIERMNKRIGQDKDRLDSLDIEVKRRIYNGYQMAFESDPKRNVKIDAGGPIDVVTSNILMWIDNIFIPSNKGLITDAKRS